jgi:enterochelin esterase family protein
LKCILVGLFFVASLAYGADKLTAPELIALTKGNPAKLQEALVATLGADAIKKGTAVLGHGPDFIFAVASSSRPVLMLDEEAGPPMKQIPKSDIWYGVGKFSVGTGHQFEYRIDGKPFGGSKDVPAYGPESYLKPGVPMGTLTEMRVHTSKVYPGMLTNYWIYQPAEYEPKTPAALMVVQDGQDDIYRDRDAHRLLDVLDNLIYEKKIPVLIVLLVQPGIVKEGTPIFDELHNMIANAAPRYIAPPRAGVPAPPPQSPEQRTMRSVEYDTVSDRYSRFLNDDILPDVIYSKYNVRRDAYSRALHGQSSGGIAAFNIAWQHPEQFSRVVSWIGSFQPIQMVPNYGGQAFPAMVARDAGKRNIRVWLQDGADDMGAWPLQNIEMANALKQRDYDFHFSFGVGTHNSAQGSAEWPETLTWLWRGYDPATTEQVYEPDPKEADKPLFRVRIYDREHGPEF